MAEFEKLSTPDSYDLTQIQENIDKAIREVTFEIAESGSTFDPTDILRRLDAIEAAYIKSVVVSGNTLTFTLQDDSTIDFTASGGGMGNAFFRSFNATSDWTVIGVTDSFFIDFQHNLNTDTPGWEIYRTDATSIFVEPVRESNVRQRLTLLSNERFSGYYIARTT